ncbi:MAG: hydroxymethylbilane synthase [Pseudomonadota bacterium]
MTTDTIRIATRESALALWQAEHVADLINQSPAFGAAELVPMTTRGDQILDKTLNKVGGKGLFIKELETAMLEGRADIAVHSMKDVPAEMPKGFALAAVLTREDPRDALVGATLAELAQGAVVGTSSLRRAAQLLQQRPDLQIKPVRGNVNTRLAKLDAGEYDAILLACAGLKRLGFEDRITEALPVTTMLPAVGQGIVGIECLAAADSLRQQLATLEDDTATVTIAAERQVAGTLGATCHSPLGVHATLEGNTITLDALLLSEDGRQSLHESASGARNEALALGQKVAEAMLARGAQDLLVEGP